MIQYSIESSFRADFRNSKMFVLTESERTENGFLEKISRAQNLKSTIAPRNRHVIKMFVKQKL